MGLSPPVDSEILSELKILVVRTKGLLKIACAAGAPDVKAWGDVGIPCGR